MNKIILLMVASLFLASCASLNPYNIEEGKGAYLQNRREIKGKARYISEFRSIRPEAYGGQHRSLKLMIADEKGDVFTVPTGKLILGLDIYYSPKVVFRSYVCNLERFYDLVVINPKVDMPSSALQGIEINALEGHVYHVNCKIEDGKAFIWIEDEDGNRVSEVVRGFRVDYSGYSLWENLPSPAL
jgi:hypothetical protein